MDFTLTIDGKGIASAESLSVLNPATGKELAQCPRATPELLEQAVSAAARVAEHWGRSKTLRSELLRECTKIFQDCKDELANLIRLETGKPHCHAVGEVEQALLLFRYYAELTEPDTLVQGAPGVGRYARPVGVVAAITPWNSPLSLAVRKIAPALRAGNAVVLKPSPHAPLATLRLGEKLREALPGILNVVAGGDDLGMTLCTHPKVDMISFTGSTKAGRWIAGATAGSMKSLVLELGGNDAAIVIDDVDLKAVSRDLFWGAFANSGQRCVAVKRLFVHNDAFDATVDALAQHAKEVVLGDGSSPDTTMGPLTTLPQLQRVQMLVEDAKEAGGTIVTGGKRLDGPGFFYLPTLVTNVKEGIELVDEEQFGPVLPILRFDTVSEAIARANKTRFGLGGSVWTRDPERAAAVARRLECGTVWWNSHGSVLVDVPSSGWKDSGVGVEGGYEGLLAYTRQQSHYAPEKARESAEARADVHLVAYKLIEMERTEGATTEMLGKSVEALKAQGVDLNEAVGARTLLMIAANFQCPMLVDVLLDAGADPNIELFGLTALVLAADFSPGKGIVERLLKAGADPGLGSPALPMSAERGDANAVDALLAAKANVNSLGIIARTALSEAIVAGHAGIVRTLLKAGADPSFPELFGRNATSWAKESDIPEIRALFEAPPEA